MWFKVNIFKTGMDIICILPEIAVEENKNLIQLLNELL